MKLKWFTAIAITAMAIISCNDDTSGIGASLTQDTEQLEVSTGIYDAYSRSILADSVYARNYQCYFGKVKDPETGAYVKSEFMTQFNIVEGFTLPSNDLIINHDDEGNIIADSCEIWLTIDRSSCYGDSLTPLKMNVLELNEPMSDNTKYYSNFDLKEGGYIRTDGVKKSFSFSLATLIYTDSIRNLSNFTDFCRIPINTPYTDKNGVTYNNYGTYIIRNYYEHPEYFRNSYTFTHTLCPGFYYELADGLGVMAKISQMDLHIFYSYKNNDSNYSTSLSFSSTIEVLQTQKVTNDLKALNRLVADESCTYLKAPAGIFTEVTLPIDDISMTHANDSLLSVSITFQRENSDLTNNPFVLSQPTNIIMLPKDSLSNFFESTKLYDYKSSYPSVLSSNTYAFSNIGNLITLMSDNKSKGIAADPEWLSKHPDWNKVVIVPVNLTQQSSTDYYGNTTYTTTGVGNEMGLTSTKLVGGPRNPIKVEVIYAKFRNK